MKGGEQNDESPHPGPLRVLRWRSIDARGETFDRYRQCEMCYGSGIRAKWIGLRELSDLLERAITMEPDYLELAREKPVSQYQDSSDAAGI